MFNKIKQKKCQVLKGIPIIPVRLPAFYVLRKKQGCSQFEKDKAHYNFQAWIYIESHQRRVHERTHTGE